MQVSTFGQRGEGGGGMWVYRHTVGEAFEFFGKIPDPWD